MNNEQILRLIKAPKKIIKNPKKKLQIINGSYRSSFDVVLKDDESDAIAIGTAYLLEREE